MSRSEWDALLQRVRNGGDRLDILGGGAYLRWSLGEGVEFWFQLDANDRVIGFNPHFAGRGRVRFGAVELRAGQVGTFDGSLYGWVDPAADPPHKGVCPLLVDIPDALLIRKQVAVPAIVTLQIAAFAHELKCFLDESAYETALAGQPHLASEALIPTGLFSPKGDLVVERAQALFTGRVLEAVLHTNPTSGNTFHALLVRTLGGTVDVVADQPLLTGEPVQGGIVLCHGSLSGRIVNEQSNNSDQ